MAITRPPWTSKYKANWDDAYQRMMAWWEGDGLDRPLVVNPAVRSNAPKFRPTRDPGDKEARDLDEQYCLEFSQYQLDTYLYLAEAAPHVRTRYDSALCMLARMAKADVHFTPDTGTAWIQKEPDLYARPLPQYDESCRPYAHAIKMIHRHEEIYGYDAVLGTDDMLDPMTTLSMMRGPGQLCMDLVDRPETVKRWVTHLGGLFLQIASGFRAARAQHGRREHFNWTSLWAPGEVEALQCDFSTMLSPEMFKEFAMPELEREAAFYDYPMWHLDGPDEIRHLEMICSAKNLRAIQWVDTKRYGPMYYIDLFKKVRKLGKSITVAAPSADVAVEVTRQVGKDGLAFTIYPSLTEGEMEQLLKRLEEV